METATFQALNTGTLIAILFLVSLGLVITFGLMGIINLAHGEFFMLGAYTVVVGSRARVAAWSTLIATPFVVGAFGVARSKAPSSGACTPVPSTPCWRPGASALSSVRS